ncbi:unnamed protein product [Lymnaea stagnalis]|uniref:protein-tyrosine-phosphatase n=1 Tax=Lymnaea stagnalis TaxID=6523 RepID=A0AAV2HT90_LYMST
MEVFDNSKAKVYNFSNQPPTKADFYTIQPDSEWVISSVEISVTRPNRSKTVLNLCEVEIFGDSHCSKDQQTDLYKYGRDCDHLCECAKPGEKCFVSTGNCPSGCKAGFYGEGCNITCKPTFYGVDCLDRCNDSCKDQLCDSVNGHCIHCAAPGKRPPLCVEDCNQGFYGDDCAMNCSKNCVDSNCNVTNGTCFDCKPGFYGTYCNTSCPSKCENSVCDRYSGHCKKCSPGFYNINCNTTCPNNCHEIGCDFLSGNCTSCKDGFQGFRCEEECTGNTYGENCELTCNKNCNSTLLTTRTCNNTVGYCLYGCREGFDGDRCNNNIKSGSRSATDSPGNDNSTLIGAVVGAIFGIIVVTLIIIGIIMWRRRGLVKKSQRRHETTDHIDISSNGNSDQDDISHGNIVTNNTTQLDNDGNGIKVKVKPAVPKKPTLTINEEKSEKSVKGSGTGYYNTVTLPRGPSTTVVTLANLRSYLLTHGKEYLYKEFQNLPTNSEATMSVGLSEENKNKNRYKNICAYDHSRVHLVVNTSKKHGDYINASYLQGFNDVEKFIASQGPTKLILDDFVRMLWEQKVDKVVMLTNLYEHGKSKCDPYWPDEDEVVFGEITVKLAATQVFADYIIRRLQLSKDGHSMHPVTQFHFTSWPDKGVPENPWALVDFEQRVAASPTKRPIVVHCSAGVGRTGTFIALRNVMREAEVTQKMDFFNTVAKLRRDRYLMVQTQEQYVFLHEAAKVAMVCLNTTITSDNIVERFQQLEKKNISGKSKLEQEFEIVCDVCVDDGETIDEEGSAGVMYQNSRTVSNKLKNRFGNILPKDCYRPLLMRESSDMEDYINAVLTPSFTKRNQDVITQLPLPTTVLDFWRLITQLKISLVVAFEEQLMTTDSTIGYYLPTDENQPASCPPFQIKMCSCVQGSEWEERKLIISGPKGAEEHSLVHLRYTQTGTDPMKLLTFIKHARTYNPKHNERTLYMCRNGATYSGLACVLTLLLDRMDNDLRLTVPLVVGAIKAIRSQVIPAVNQYKILYQILKLYNETNSIYSNFNDTKSSVAPETSGQDNMGFVGNEGTEYANAKL